MAYKKGISPRGRHGRKGGKAVPRSIRRAASVDGSGVKGNASTGLVQGHVSSSTHLRPPNANEVRRTRFSSSLEEVRAGLPYDALERLRVDAALTQAQLAKLLGIPERTIARRKIDGRLTPSESDRVDRTARILTLSTDVLEDEDRARVWLQKPNRGLGGLTPLSLLDTDRGSRAVEEALMAIEYGMYG